MSEARQAPFPGFLDVLSVALLSFALIAPAVVILPRLGLAPLPTFLALLCVTPGAMLASVWIVARAWRGRSWADLGLVPVRPRQVMFTAAVWLLALPLIGLLNQVVLEWLGRDGANPQIRDLEPLLATPLLFAAALVIAGLAAPLAEELVFRGLLYRWLRGRTGRVFAALSSSLLFAGMHGYGAVILPTFLLGLLFAWSLERTGSLWTPIALHALHNSSQLVVFYVAARNGWMPSG